MLTRTSQAGQSAAQPAATTATTAAVIAWPSPSARNSQPIGFDGRRVARISPHSENDKPIAALVTTNPSTAPAKLSPPHAAAAPAVAIRTADSDASAHASGRAHRSGWRPSVSTVMP
jgi:hypothetical protein